MPVGPEEPPVASLRVHVYVDGFNLYRGGLELAGLQPGWKWLDIPGLAQRLAEERWATENPLVEQLYYCTTLIDPTPTNPDGPKRQKTFINALRASDMVHVEYGRYISKVKRRPIATRDKKGRPILVKPQGPVLIKDGADQSMNDAIFLVSVADREEKGSDVNVATLLLLDALQAPPAMHAAIVISNDSDLKLPIDEVRKRLPVGVVNPGRGYTAGALRHDPDVHVPGQWERRLVFSDYTTHQLPDLVGDHAKPIGW
jgi:hypothetical protein